MKHPIPRSALDDRLAIVGTSGSGKTYGAGSAVELLLEANARVLIVDPLGVWWGLGLDADGKRPSIFRQKEKLVIFGGAHGDMPLLPASGALMGETIAGMAESCILDLSEMGSDAEQRRFMLALLTSLFKHKVRDLLHVIVDEADMWAPQLILDKDGEAPKLLGMMQKIVKRGRVFGFIPWLITQNPAGIAKSVLGQVSGMVAFSLTSSQDRDAIGAWVKGQADEAQWKGIWGTMPTLETGRALIWLPRRNKFEIEAFPRKVTFDSSRAPKRGERVTTKKLVPINLDKLKERLGKVEAEIKANDPKALRAEVARLQRELTLKSTQVAAAPAIDPEALAEADRTGFQRGYAKGISAGRSHIVGVMGELRKDVDRHYAEAQRLADKAFDEGEAIPPPVPRAVPTVAPQKPSYAKPATPNAVTPKPPTGDRDTEIEQKLLDALAELQALGVAEPARELVAMMARYSLHTNRVKAAIVKLKEDGLIQYGTGTLILTAIGAARASAAGAPVNAREMRDRIIAILGEPSDKLLEHMTSIYPNDCSREELATACGYSIHTNKVKSAIVKLKDMGFFTYPGQGRLRASENLFPGGR